MRAKEKPVIIPFKADFKSLDKLALKLKTIQKLLREISKEKLVVKIDIENS